MSGETVPEQEPEDKINLTLVLVVFVAGLLAALALPQMGNLMPQPGVQVPSLTVYRIDFAEDEAVLHVVNDGPVPVEIGAVQVGGPFPMALRDHHVDPDPHLERFDTARIHVPLRWTEAVPYEFKIIASDGAAFTADAVARPTGAGGLLTPILLGIGIGVVPVYLGMAPLPWMKRLDPGKIRLLGGLAAGVLGFLLVDTLAEAAEVAQRLPLAVGPPLVVGGFVLGLAPLVWYGRTKLGTDRSQAPLAAAYLVAVAIGLHNLGEGLAVGAAYATGAIALAALLVVGFALHNVTEGVAILAPALDDEGLGWRHVGAMGLIAGGPVIPGAVLSSLVTSNALTVLFFSIAVGAILYVIAEILFGLAEEAPGSGHDDPMIFGGLAIGLVIMYATDVLLHVWIGG